MIRTRSSASAVNNSKRRAEQRSALVWTPAVTAARRFCRLAVCARPVAWIHSAGNAAAKGRIRPIRRMLDQTVLDRIETDVIEMGGEIPLVTDCVLPIVALPDTAFAAFGHNRRSQAGNDLANAILIARQRPGKSASPSGKLHTQCMWSGSTTHPSTRNGARVLTRRTASRSASMCLTSRPSAGLEICEAYIRGEIEAGDLVTAFLHSSARSADTSRS
jgi:hypothetical protein